MACRDEQIDCIEPNLQGRPRVLKDRPSGRVDVIATGRARERAAVCELVEGAFHAAGAAHMPLAVPDFHDVGETGVVIREAGEKLADSQPPELVQFGFRCGAAGFAFSGGHGSLPMAVTVSLSHTCVKGIIPKKMGVTS